MRTRVVQPLLPRFPGSRFFASAVPILPRVRLPTELICIKYPPVLDISLAPDFYWVYWFSRGSKASVLHTLESKQPITRLDEKSNANDLDLLIVSKGSWSNLADYPHIGDLWQYIAGYHDGVAHNYNLPDLGAIEKKSYKEGFSRGTEAYLEYRVKHNPNEQGILNVDQPDAACPRENAARLKQ